MPTSWLPPLILVESCNHDWTMYDRVVYEKFRQDLILHAPNFQPKRFSINKSHRVDDREAVFWHLVTEGPKESERTLDVRRCERIAWIKALVEEYPSERVCLWKTERPHRRGGGKETRILLAPTDFSYVVVLADKGSYALLITAYSVAEERRRLKLKKEFEDWKKAGDAV